MEISKIVAWAVMSNTDLTEGRGKTYPLAYCLDEAVAIAYGKGKHIMGTDCPIKSVYLYKIVYNGACLYFPLDSVIYPILRMPTEYELAVQKAKSAGLTDADIQKLQRFDLI